MPHSPGFRRRRDERAPHAAPIGDVVAGLLREPLFARGMAVARLAADWESVVGARLAVETAPVALESGVLAVSASSGPWAAQVRFLAEELRAKANEALGEPLVRSVQISVRLEPPNPL